MLLRSLGIRAVICALLINCAGHAALPRAFAQTAADTRQVAEQVLDHAIIIDTHADTPQVMIEEGYDLANSAPKGMEDVSKIPALVRELARRGYSEEDLEKILGGNVLRVMRQVEQVARQMPAARGSSEQ
jgi:microsomal dipeptidase-like Zn-dependent dipeptidase